jgi:hypothetical protein
MRRSLVLAVLLAACSDGGEQIVDAPPVVDDAPSDMATDSGPCGTGRFVTGELLDLDSSNASFKGANNVRLTVQSSTASDATSPNGRFELCVPSASGAVTFDMVANANATPRYMDGFVYLDGDAIFSAILISLRTFDQARRTSFYEDLGLTYDATKAHVIVWTSGITGAVALDRDHDEAQAGTDVDGDGAFTWSSGAVGAYVLFPNVDVTNATGTISGDSLPIDHTIPLAADKLTIAGVSSTLQL